MEKDYLRELKEDLKIAIANKDYKKIEEISRILKLSDEQTMYFDMGLTGFPSIDKTWLKYYRDGADALGVTVGEVVEEVVEVVILVLRDG